MNAEQALSHATIESLLEEIAILKERLAEARNKALDEAYDAWRYAEEKDDVGSLILSLKDTQ